MKRIGAATVLIIFAMVIIVPAATVWLLGGPSGATDKNRARYKGEDVPIKVYLHEHDQVVEMKLEEYLKGVVAAEMPAEFELEALKAQAVAARTYAVQNMSFFGKKGSSEKHNADISTDPRQGQAWISEAKLKARWGTLSFSKYWTKISRAVDQTQGIIMTYQDEPINAVFHSTSGPKTASAREVWGSDYPYLQSITCNWDNNSPRYHETKEYSVAEIEKQLGQEAGVVAAVQNGNKEAATIISRTESGRVAQVRIGTKTFSGLEVREKLNLRSTNFEINQKDDKLVFTTTGYGHGVGMSQYGANGMARAGKKYKDILSYFYKGINFKNIHGS